jgi:hypothetical protein
VLADLLSPWAGHRLWCAEDVIAELTVRRLELRSETMVAGLDLRSVFTDPRGAGEPVLDFLVGASTAATTAEVHEHLVAYLAEMVPPGNPGMVPHPVDITIARVP